MILGRLRRQRHGQSLRCRLHCKLLVTHANETLRRIRPRGCTSCQQQNGNEDVGYVLACNADGYLVHPPVHELVPLLDDLLALESDPRLRTVEG